MAVFRTVLWDDISKRTADQGNVRKAGGDENSL